MKRHVLGFDIGSNSVGSAWIDRQTGQVTTGISIFPAGVEESDIKRGDPKNTKRRMTRRTRITLARRAERKRQLRLRLIREGLLPADPAEFSRLLETTDPWTLRRKGLDEPLTPYEFGRVLLHLAQRRGALGLRLDEPDNDSSESKEEGKVKAAIGAVRAKMLQRDARTFGEFIALLRAERVTALSSEDRRPVHRRRGAREHRDPVRNKADSYEHCADRQMIRDEFQRLWEAQKSLGGSTAKLLTNVLRLALDDESGDAVWRHMGLLFKQRRQTWDLGTLGRCVLEPTERCAPHADLYASRYLVVETVNNLKIIEQGKEARPLTPEERAKIKTYLSGPLGIVKTGKFKGQPKHAVSVTDLRELMGWGRATKTTCMRFNIENDLDRSINTDWFSRDIIHGAVTPEKWTALPERVREGLNRAILKYDPDQPEDASKLKAGVMHWAGLDEDQANTLVAAWKRRPKPDAKRLNLSRRAVRNLLAVMDRAEPWPDPKRPGQVRWLTQIEARKLIAGDAEFRDVTTGMPLDEHARRRYATGAKGATARDRYYMGKHVLLRAGQPVIGPDGEPLAEPPPAPLISNPVVRKAIHEVRRHLIEYMTTFGRKPDEIYIELAREARMGAKDADRLLFRNRLRNRIRNDIIRSFQLEARTATQQRAAVDRVVLCVQQNGVCPLCGNQAVTRTITPRMAAESQECEVAHIIPRASGGHNGLSNLVLAHTKCNRDMGRRTAREFWSDGAGSDKGTRWVEGIYGDVARPKPSEVRGAEGAALWSAYFTKRDDCAKIEQFKKDIKDIQEMTERQAAATKYAARQVMSYLADALYDGKGLPERSMGAGREEDERRIYTTDGMWTSRLRREWGLRFDPHLAGVKGTSSEAEHLRKEKNRGDHRHHAIDAVVIALCSRSVQRAWEERERRAELELPNSADEEALENYRRRYPLEPPRPFDRRDGFRDAVRQAVFRDGESERPVCHRPVKRKLVGPLHWDNPFGAVLDRAGNFTTSYTKRISLLELGPKHLRMPHPETAKEAVDRLATRRRRETGANATAARRWARAVVSNSGYTPALVDPPPGKTGIVRDRALRRRLRQCLSGGGLDPDGFTKAQVKKLVTAGKMQHVSGVPIRSAVLLYTISDPVLIDRRRPDHGTGRILIDERPTSKRAYVGGFNHHIEIRVAADKRGREVWSGEIISMFEAAQRKLAKLRALRKSGIPKPKEFRRLPADERRKLTPTLRAIEQAHPIVDRSDDAAKGGRFVMSLCEGEMLYMRHKASGEVGYYVIAKLDKPRNIVLVPHWDARAATGRKDAEGKNVPDSKREQFSVTPTDLQRLAPPDHAHAVKVRVSPLGNVFVPVRD